MNNSETNTDVNGNNNEDWCAPMIIENNYDDEVIIDKNDFLEHENENNIEKDSSKDNENKVMSGIKEEDYPVLISSIQIHDIEKNNTDNLTAENSKDIDRNKDKELTKENESQNEEGINLDKHERREKDDEINDENMNEKLFEKEKKLEFIAQNMKEIEEKLTENVKEINEVKDIAKEINDFQENKQATVTDTENTLENKETNSTNNTTDSAEFKDYKEAKKSKESKVIQERIKIKEDEYDDMDYMEDDSLALDESVNAVRDNNSGFLSQDVGRENGLVRSRRYDVSITYDKYYQVRELLERVYNRQT